MSMEKPKFKTIKSSVHNHIAYTQLMKVYQRGFVFCIGNSKYL